MLLEDGHDFGRVGYRPSRSDHLELLEEYIEAAWNDGRDNYAGRGSNVLKCVPTSARGEYGRACSGMDFLPVDFKPEFALDYIP